MAKASLADNVCMNAHPPIGRASTPAALSLQKRILVLVDSDAIHHQDILHGLKMFAAERSDWVLRYASRHTAMHALVEWRPDGVIMHQPLAGARRAFARLRLPQVSLMESAGKLPLAGLDNRRIGVIVGQDFLRRSFRDLAIIIVQGQPWSLERLAGFASVARMAGCRLHLYRIKRTAPSSGTQTNDPRPLQIWLQELPKPVAVFAANDVWGVEVIQLCKAGDIRVPEELAVVGADNNEQLCDMVEPELSSVAIPWHEIGYQAGALLESMMRGGKPASPKLLLAPGEIITRGSSDTAATGHPYLAKALRFINEHACEGIGVPEVLRAVPVGRRWLERMCMRKLRRTPLEEIHRVRLGRAKRLLAETNLPVRAVGLRCGIDEARFCKVFRKATGLTPSAWRRSSRAGGHP